MNLEERTELIGEYMYKLDAWLQGAGYELMNAEQLDCVSDPARACEAYGMLEDLEDRVLGRGRVSHILARVYAALCESMEENVKAKTGDMDALRALMREWIGHDDILPGDDAASVEKLLTEWVQALWESSDCYVPTPYKPHG